MTNAPAQPTHDPESLRLQVALARAGFASRRAAARAIEAGRVSVNGRTVRAPSHRVRPAVDTIRVDEEEVGAEPLRYYLLHKRRGVLSSAGDDRGRASVTDSLPPDAGRCVPVGRLDLESEGLVLLTNDGPLIDRLLHPRNQIARTYLVEMRGQPSDATLQRFFDGVPLDDGMIAQAKPRRSGRRGRPAVGRDPGTAWLTLTLHQGRKRELRRMAAAVGHPLLRLIRVRFGPLQLRDLALGAIRPLSDQEVRLLQRGAGPATPPRILAAMPAQETPAQPSPTQEAPAQETPVPTADPADSDAQPLRVVAIDGPVASGKTAVGRLLAERLGWRMLDTGIMYRALTWHALETATNLDDDQALTDLARSVEMRLEPAAQDSIETATILIDGRDATPHLRKTYVEASVSTVAAVPGVRESMVERQRREALRHRLIMIGRDIGTVVAPDAALKIYLTASPAVRAARRAAEMRKGGRAANDAEVQVEIVRRDQLDAGRAASPLRLAENAVELDTSDLALEAVVETVIELMRERSLVEPAS